MTTAPYTFRTLPEEEIKKLKAGDPVIVRRGGASRAVVEGVVEKVTPTGRVNVKIPAGGIYTFRPDGLELVGDAYRRATLLQRDAGAIEYMARVALIDKLQRTPWDRIPTAILQEFDRMLVNAATKGAQ